MDQYSNQYLEDNTTSAASSDSFNSPTNIRKSSLARKELNRSLAILGFTGWRDLEPSKDNMPKTYLYTTRILIQPNT